MWEEIDKTGRKGATQAIEREKHMSCPVINNNFLEYQ